MSVTPTVPQETLMSCFHRSHQLLLVPTLSLCTSPVWIAGSTQSGLIEQDPHSSNFQSCSEWFKRGGQNWVGMTCCLDRAVHAPHGADACSTNSSLVDTLHVDPWNSRDSVEQRVQNRVRRNRVDLVQLGGQVTNPEDRDTAFKRRGYKTRYAQQHRLATVSDRARWRAKLEECWRPITRVGRAEQEITISSGVCCRFGSGSASSWWKSILTFPWNWNVLTTWPIESEINEAALFCAREGKKGILTNCAGTARLVGRSRCCKSLLSRLLVQSSLANLFVSHEVCLWNVSIQEDSVYSLQSSR